MQNYKFPLVLWSSHSIHACASPKGYLLSRSTCDKIWTLAFLADSHTCLWFNSCDNPCIHRASHFTSRSATIFPNGPSRATSLARLAYTIYRLFACEPRFEIISPEQIFESNSRANSDFQYTHNFQHFYFASVLCGGAPSLHITPPSLLARQERVQLPIC